MVEYFTANGLTFSSRSAPKVLDWAFNYKELDTLADKICAELKQVKRDALVSIA
ncbi:MAG: hypothetical protein LBE31_02655 [Deltaproteobacteria bacterium]|nr:hypothetical protein [Deltaproteobacteria bacterium]